eukprot:XP_001698225.1 flagellar associated protein [Chlamydomonas reinhardtii]
MHLADVSSTCWGWGWGSSCAVYYYGCMATKDFTDGSACSYLYSVGSISLFSCLMTMALMGCPGAVAGNTVSGIFHLIWWAIAGSYFTDAWRDAHALPLDNWRHAIMALCWTAVAFSALQILTSVGSCVAMRKRSDAYEERPGSKPSEKAPLPAKLAGLQTALPQQDFQKIIVHGKPKEPDRERKAVCKPPNDQHLPTSRLKLFCFDKTTGKPLANVQVAVKTLPNNDPDKSKSVSNAFGNRAFSRKDGYVSCKVLAGYPYLISATASGFHDFGHMGEHLLLRPGDGEVVEAEVGLVPIRIAVVVTLRELRPLHHPDSMQRDVTGQVNPLFSLPKIDTRFGVPPQRVSFYSSEGIKMDFVATTVESQDVLVGWPGTLGNTAEAATCSLGIYSTDNDGHCFFYGPKVGGKRGNGRKPRDWSQIDVGRWEYTCKYHLRANWESPVCMLFESYRRQVDYPAHVARYPPRGDAKDRLNASPGKRRASLAALLPGSREELAASREALALAPELEAELAVYPDNNIHNYLDPGEYKLQMKDPSRLLIFYTYSGDGEAAEINRAQNAVVPFTMRNTDDSFIHPRDGSILRPTQFPVQLYCRARPWFHIAVYDVESLEEVGTRYGLFFTIERITIQPAGTKARGSEGDGMSNGGGPGRRLKGQKDERNADVDAYLEKQKEKGKLAHLWAKAEVAEAEATGKQFLLPQDSEALDPNVFPYKVEEVEVVSELMYSGHLGANKDKMWMTPGDKYRLTVQMRTPFLDYDAVQVRVANWELEPFVFYAMRKVVLLVGVREAFNQQPMPHTEVVVEVREPPQPPRPPVVKPEWCEAPSAYAQRIIDQLIDYVVQNNREAMAVEKGPASEQRGYTDAEGLVSFEVPPESRVFVRAVNTVDFEATESTSERLLTSEPEQFVGFQLQRICRTAAVVLDSATGEGVPGFTLKGYDITDYVPDVPKEGSKKVRQLLDPDLLDDVDVEALGLEPFQVETTGPDGAAMQPFCRRAGRVIKPGDAAQRQRAVICHDTCTFEEIYGVRFRVMVRRIEAPPPPPENASGAGRRSANSRNVGMGVRAEEDDATLKRRAEEEAMMAVFDQAPEEEEPWGRVIWDSVTGLEENDNLILEEDAEVAVQIFPCWPYDVRSQMLKGRAVGHVGPPDFRFYLPRDGDAFRFWLERDKALPDFWDEQGAARLPYHPLARLQPLAPPHRLLARPHGDLKLLRPPAFDLNAITDPAVTADTDPRLASANATPRVNFADVPLTIDDGGKGTKSGLVPKLSLAGPEAEDLRSALKGSEEVRKLHRTVSAVQYDPNDANEDMNDLAWNQLRLSDASYLPLERTRLLQFLTKWGSFPHIQGGHCKACADRFARTHAIVAHSEAIYCKSPFFTWWLPNGGGVHVAVNDGLYRDLIPLIDAVALSVNKVNEGRGKHGRFLLGHEVVDSFCGGVFILDVFMLEQLSKTFDYWAGSTPEGMTPPRFNVLLCSRDVVECWRSGLGYVTEGLLGRLRPWYEDVKQKMPAAPGFNMEKALRTAAGMAKSQVPLFLLCGGLLESPLNTPTEMSRVLYDMQLACINTQAPMQPVHAVELYPMPQARDSLACERVRLLELFREVDKDSDGCLDWSQLYRLVLRLVPDATPAHIRYVQLLLDRTGDNRVRYKDLAAAVRACSRGGITVSLRDRLEVALVLHKMAITMLVGRVTPAELFARYDCDEDSYWSEKEQWNMLKDLFPGLRPAEHALLFEAFQDVDKNGDGRISRDEWSRAFSAGGVPGLPGTGMLGTADQIQRMKDAGELDDFTIMAMKAAEENKRLSRIRGADFPLTAALVKIAGATRGMHRRLDLGRARAFADPIDLVPLQQVRDALDANLQQLLAFEKAYGKQLTAEYQDRPFRNYPGQANPLTADPGSLARGGARKRPASANRALRPTRESSSAYSSSSAATSIAPSSAHRAGGLGSTAGRSGAGSYREPPSPSRPDSASRQRPPMSPVPAWATAAAASDDPHLRKLAEHEASSGELPMKSAMLGFEGEGLEGGASGGLPFLSSPDPNAPPAGAGASGAGSRPSSAGRRSFGPAGFRMDSGNSRTSQGWV